MLEPPPSPAVLAGIPSRPLRALRLHRVYRSGRASPWWFASRPEQAGTADGGRFDLQQPDGACYLATSSVGAVLEALQDFGGLVPRGDLQRLRRAEVAAGARAPRAGWLTAKRTRAVGVTAALWAGTDRVLTQAWATALRRAGWRALYSGVQHDPAGQLRAVTLFDSQGEHAPYDDPDGWPHTSHSIADDAALLDALSSFGVHVAESELAVRYVALEEER